MTPSAPDSPRPTRIRYVVLTLACLTSFILYLHRYAWGVIKPDVKAEFGLDDEQLGWLDSAFNITYAIFQVPIGLLGDLVGPALVLPLIIGLWSGAVALTSWAAGLWPLAGVRLFFGAAQAGTYPNLSTVTRSWFPLSSRTTVQGFIASASGRAGGACASIVVSALLIGALGLSWRWALVVISFLGGVLVVGYLLLFRSHPAFHPRVNDAERRLISAGETEDDSTRKNRDATNTPADKNDLPESTNEVSAPTRFTRDRAAWISFSFLLFHMFASAFADQLYVYWIPLFLEEEKGLSKTAMGFYASLPLLAGALGGLFGGVLNDWLLRLFGRRFARATVGLVGKLLSAVLMLISLQFESGRAVMIVIACSKFFTDWSQPTTWGTVTDIAGRASGRVFGTVNMVGSIGTVIAGPVLGGLKKDFGWNAVFTALAVVYVAAALAWLGIDASRRLMVRDRDTES